ncbi:MAG: hypothetical protein PHG48_01510 [Eubacteriales bacterium]|nr:hypothetical protein [Eubacteriales bacterium]
MRKALSLMMVLVFAFSFLAACESGGKTPDGSDVTSDAAASQTAAAQSSDTKIGLGLITTIKSSKDLGVDSTGGEVLPLGQADTVIVAALFDKDGKVVKAVIDTVQAKVQFDKDLKITTDFDAPIKTKVELGIDYNMVKASVIKKEWFEQASALADWMTGKTAAEIKNMKTYEKDASHPAVPDVPELKSAVTITVGDYLAALEKAYVNAKAAPGAKTLGIGHEISIKSSKSYLKNEDGTEVLPLAQIDAVITAVTMDAEGKVAGAIIDTAQTKIQFDNAGKITTDKAGAFRSKLELGSEYGMIRASSIQKDWYQQSESLAGWMNGKTIDEIKAMKTYEKDASHPAVPDEPELKSSVTINVKDYLMAADEAVANAK